MPGTGLIDGDTGRLHRCLTGVRTPVDGAARSEHQNRRTRRAHFAEVSHSAARCIETAESVKEGRHAACESHPGGFHTAGVATSFLSTVRLPLGRPTPWPECHHPL